MKKRSLPGLIIIFVLVASVFGQRRFEAPATSSGGALIAEQAAFDVTFYELSVAVNTVERSIAGTLTVHARFCLPSEWLVLDLDEALKVETCILVQSDRGKLGVERRGGKIWIQLGRTRQPGENVVVEVNYGGSPREAPHPPWVGGFVWSTTADGQPWIATAVQMDGADLWWPCKDHPSDEPDSMRIRVTVPKPLVVASNGRLIEVLDEDMARTYHWFVSTPINNYDVALNIAPYLTIRKDYKSTTGEVIPVTYWVLPENYAKGVKLFPEFLQHLRFYEELLGPYPFRADKYGVAETPHLGMEHQTIIAYGNNYRTGEFGYDWLHHHELGHEWWGNLVTAFDWRDFWLHEGFCAYMQPLYTEQLHGRAEYRQEMTKRRPGIRNLKPLAPRSARTAGAMYFTSDGAASDGDIYAKGAWILHTLRYLIGDEAFFLALRRMAYPTQEMERLTDGRQCRFATSDDFVDIVQEITGRDLGWFFEIYLRQPDLPRLVVRRDDTDLHLQWMLPEGALPFELPVEIEADQRSIKLDMAGGEGMFDLTSVSEYHIDPENWLLMELQEVTSRD